MATEEHEIWDPKVPDHEQSKQDGKQDGLSYVTYKSVACINGKRNP
jgi:hypothetical protein